MALELPRARFLPVMNSIRRVHSVGSNVANSIRSPVRRTSNIRHPKRASSDVGFFRFDQPSVECRIFDIRSASDRMLDF